MEPKKLKCIIVDDEPLAREGIVEYAGKISFLEVVGSYESALEVLHVLNTQQVDLIILDIEMPTLTGIDLLKTLTTHPLCIIISANPQFAIEGYDLEVFDYLLKPVSFDRFLKSVKRAYDKFLLLDGDRKNENASQQQFFFIKNDRGYEKIEINDIIYIEGLQNYVFIHTHDKKHTVYITLKIAEQKLPIQSFIRVHKSYIVNVSAINAIQGNELKLHSGASIPIGREKKEEVLQILLNGNLLKRE